MNGTIVMLQTEYKDNKDIRCFDSVSACAIHFAREARRQYAIEKGLRGDDLFNAIVQDVALLFARYDATTNVDPEEVHGGNDNTKYSFTLKTCVDLQRAKADAKIEDEIVFGKGVTKNDGE